MRSSADELCACCIFNAALTTLGDERASIEASTLVLEKHQFPGYELLGEIARGGMGVVFRARQFRPDRVVALKVIASGELASPKMVERFHAEAETAARLEHPNIVPIFEVGSEGHWHFFSMRLIEGATLAQVLAKGRLPQDHACALMVKIVRAVQYAHSRGVLHRDIKPGNILIDSKGEPHLTDFGLAKVLEGDSAITHSEAVIGTPAYMAPEQASGNARDATTAADVYALGAVLYETLAGRPPFTAENTPALLRKIVEIEPKPPSASLVHRPPFSIEAESPEHRIQRRSSFVNPSDLDAIALKCLEKDPALRYHSAEAFADDLERALKGEPILAQPSTATQRLRKWVRRNTAKTALIATVVLAGFILMVVSLSFNVRLTRARNRALTDEAEARRQILSAHLRENAQLNAIGNAMLGMFPLIEAARIQTNDPAGRQRLRERLSASLRFSPQLRRLWDAGGTPIQLQFSRDGHRLLAVLRSGEPLCWDLNTSRLIKHPDVAGRSRRASFIDPDGSRVMEFFNEAPYAQLWNVTAGTLTPVLLQSGGGGVAAFSPDGKTVATGGDHVRLWDTATGEERPVAITNSARSLWLLFSPDGEQLITGHEKEQAWRWDVHTGVRLNDIPMKIRAALPARFSADGEELLLNAGGIVQVMNWPSGVVQSSMPLRPLYDMNLSPAGRQLATAAYGDQAWVWDVGTGRPFGLPITHETGANKVLFSPDGSLLVTAGFDYQLRVVLASNHQPLFPAIHRSSFIEAVVFSPDSRFLALGDEDGIVQVWDLQSVAQPFFPGADGVSLIETDDRFMLTEDSRVLRVFDLSNGAEIGQPRGVPPEMIQPSIAPSRRFITGVFANNTASIWDLYTHQVIHKIMPTEGLTTRDMVRLVIKPDDSEFLTMTAKGWLQRWSMASGEPVGPPMDHGEKGSLLAWSGDGRWVLAAGDSSVTVWDARTSLPLGAPIRCSSIESISAAWFSPDSTRLLIACKNRGIEPASAKIYELPSLRLAAAPLRHGDGVASASFSSDGKWVATGGEDNVARIWRVADAQPVTGPMRHNGMVISVLFSPDSRVLATGCSDGNIRLWDVERGELLAPPIQFRAGAQPICFTPDGRKLFIYASYSKATIWVISLAPNEMPLEKVQTLAECQSGLRADRTQGAIQLSSAELAGKFSTLVASNSPMVTIEDTQRWHSERATVAELQGAWFTAAFHLQRLLAASPDDVALKERLARARRELSIQPRR